MYIPRIQCHNHRTDIPRSPNHPHQPHHHSEAFSKIRVAYAKVKITDGITMEKITAVGKDLGLSSN